MFLSSHDRGYCTLGYLMEVMDNELIQEFYSEIIKNEPENLHDNFITAMAIATYEGEPLFETKCNLHDLWQNLRVYTTVECVCRLANMEEKLKRKNYTIMSVDTNVLGSLSLEQVAQTILIGDREQAFHFLRSIK